VIYQVQHRLEVHKADNTPAPARARVTSRACPSLLSEVPKP